MRPGWTVGWVWGNERSRLPCVPSSNPVMTIWYTSCDIRRVTRRWTIGLSSKGFIPYATTQRLRWQVVGMSTDITTVGGERPTSKVWSISERSAMTYPAVSRRDERLSPGMISLVFWISNSESLVGVNIITQEAPAHWVRRLFNQTVGNYWVW